MKTYLNILNNPLKINLIKFTRLVSIKNEALFCFTDLFRNASKKTESESLMSTLFPNEEFRQRHNGVRI